VFTALIPASVSSYLCVKGTPLQNSIDVSIVIVNWRSAEFLRKCLATIYAQTRSVRFEVIVIDNASFDGSAEIVEREFPRVQFIQAKENLGFAKANNLAFNHSRGRTICFLNPDTEILDAAIENLIDCLESHADAGVVGAKLLNSDLSLQTSCVQSYPTVLNQLLDADFFRRLFPKSSLWGTRPLFEAGQKSALAEVVSGACFLVRRATFEQVAGFTERYFMYAEDVDLCYKAKLAGWNVYYHPEAHVIHHGGQSSSKNANAFATVMTRQSLYTFLKTTRGKGYAFLYRGSMLIAAVARLLLLAMVMVATLGQFERESVPLAFQKWSSVFQWAIGLNAVR